MYTPFFLVILWFYYTINECEMSLNLSYNFINIPKLKFECLFAALQIALTLQYNRLFSKSKDPSSTHTSSQNRCYNPPPPRNRQPSKKSVRLRNLCIRTDFLFLIFLLCDFSTLFAVHQSGSDLLLLPTAAIQIRYQSPWRIPRKR